MAGSTVSFTQKPRKTCIAKDKIVHIRYRLFDIDNDTVAAERNDLSYLHGGYGDIFPRLEEALEGLVVGDKTEVTLTAEQAYGPYDPGLVISEPDDSFPAAARRLGAQLDCHAPDGSVVPFRVVELENSRITVDGNHPLAGKDLRFIVEVFRVRPATASELQAGYSRKTSSRKSTDNACSF